MAKSLGVHGAKAHLSQLMDDVAAGEEGVITRLGEPAARLVALPTAASSSGRSGNVAHP